MRFLPLLLAPLLLAAKGDGVTPKLLPTEIEGKGLAAKYPGDKGIERDPRVVFVEKFDSRSLGAVFKRWENVTGKDAMSLSRYAVAGSADRTSLRIKHIGGRGTGGQLYRRLKPHGHDRIFARFYVKISRDCAPIHHFGTHLGGFNPSTAWPQGGAGEDQEG